MAADQGHYFDKLFEQAVLKKAEAGVMEHPLRPDHHIGDIRDEALASKAAKILQTKGWIAKREYRLQGSYKIDCLMASMPPQGS